VIENARGPLDRSECWPSESQGLPNRSLSQTCGPQALTTAPPPGMDAADCPEPTYTRAGVLILSDHQRPRPNDCPAPAVARQTSTMA
jgi:hypothetical protein